jgi:hypothetical protein
MTEAIRREYAPRPGIFLRQCDALPAVSSGPRIGHKGLRQEARKGEWLLLVEYNLLYCDTGIYITGALVSRSQEQ